MAREEPRAISVGMPVFNGERYLESAIRSILGQTFPDFELIISDNASTDRTAQICRDFAAQDDRIVYTRNSQNIGAARNYNAVFALAAGRYFRWANADDVSARTLHAACMKVLDDNPDAVLCYGKTQLIDSDGRFLQDYADNLDLPQARPSERFRRFFESVGLTNAIYGLMRTSAMKRTALMGTGRLPAADIPFMAELVLHGKFLELPETLFFRRMHASASSGDRTDQVRQTEFWSGQRGSFTLPAWRFHWAKIRGIARAPVQLSEKARLMLHVARQMYWDWGRLAKELAQPTRSPMFRPPSL